MTTPYSDRHDVIVVGGSQAGLAMAWHLARQGLRFVVLDAGKELGEAWTSRWDSLKLFTSSEFNALPGMSFPGPPDSYPTKDMVAAYLKDYAAAFHLQVRPNARVMQVSPTPNGEFEVRTVGGDVYRARQVVVATGPFESPYVPTVATRLEPSVTQIHSSRYRRPDTLPDGPVLVVGGGNSGFQIAAELVATRPVDLSIGTRYLALPQRLLGRDLFWWLTRLGLMRVTVDSRLGRRARDRGEFVIGNTRRRLERAGVRLRPRVVAAEGRTVRFADASSLDVATVIWATGYTSDYTWVHVPGVVEGGRVIHRRGVTDVPGLYFLGLTWQHTRGSALLGFVQDDAAYLSDRIAQRHAAVAGAVAGTREETIHGRPRS